jgi:hypothetical protein
MAGDMALVSTMIGVTSILAGITSELIGVRAAILVFASAAACASVVYIFATTEIRKRLQTEQQQQ